MMINDYADNDDEDDNDGDDDVDFSGLEERSEVWSVSKGGWNSKQGDEEKGLRP